METRYLKNIEKGMRVEILNHKNKKIIGIIEDVAPRKEYDEKGIMVRLKTGEVGRAQEILRLDESQRDEVIDLVNQGESFSMEFKSNALWSENYSDKDVKKSKSYLLHTHKRKTSRIIIARSIAAFMNSEGGNLLIGVCEKKKGHGGFLITGIGEDLDKLKKSGKDYSLDGYKRMIIDDIMRPFFPSKIYNYLNDYISIGFYQSDHRIICHILIKKSDVRVFLNLSGKKVFMIRTESENRQLKDEDLVEYCMKRWRI